MHTHWIPGFQKVLEATLDEPDKDKRKMLLYGDFMTRTLWAITYSSTNIFVLTFFTVSASGRAA